MTNQEAISVLESINAKTDYFLINDDARAEAIDMAISALEKQDVPDTDGDMISRQVAINEINERQRKLIYCFGSENDMVKIMDIAKTIISTIPPAQPERKTGKWMPDNTNYYDERYICSRCGCNYKVGMCMGKPLWNFCPNCGSYNGGDSDEQQ